MAMCKHQSVGYGRVGERILAEPRSRFPLGVTFARAKSCGWLKFVGRAVSESTKPTLETSAPASLVTSFARCVYYIAIKCPCYMKCQPRSKQVVGGDADLLALFHGPILKGVKDRRLVVLEAEARREQSVRPRTAPSTKIATPRGATHLAAALQPIPRVPLLAALVERFAEELSAG